MVSDAGLRPDLPEQFALASGRDLRDVLRGILKTITQLPWLHADAGGVFFADPGSRRLELAAHIDFTPQRISPGCADPRKIS